MQAHGRIRKPNERRGNANALQIGNFADRFFRGRLRFSGYVGNMQKDAAKNRVLFLCFMGLFFALFLCCAVAGAGHGAVGTVAAAGGFALFLIFYEAE